MQNGLDNPGPFTIFLVFSAGLLTSLGPCSLSLLPVTIAYIGGTEKNKFKLISFSGGVVFSLVGLGAASGFLGKIYGQIPSYYTSFVALIAIIMGLNLLGILKFQFPNGPDIKIIEEEKEVKETTKTEDGMELTKTGLKYKDITAGEGESPKTGDKVVVHYTGTLEDGTKFDSSYDRNQPSTIPLSRLIPGWSQGIQLMTVGSTFQFFIPGHLAYGQEVGPVGAMATLICQVDLLEVIRQAD